MSKMSFLRPITLEEREKLDPNNETYLPYRIARFRLWTAFLSPDQYYLGRTYLWLNRHEDMQRIDHLTEEEHYHLAFVVGKRIKVAVDGLFAPDAWNEAWLGNEFAVHRGHGHLHLIPRYATARIYRGETFVDENWGRNYAPYQHRPLPMADIIALISEIRNRL